MAEKVYGIADKAWQCVVGCDPHMPCAPRCWARKTVKRMVLCMEHEHASRAEFFQVALTPDGKQWSGKTFLDPVRLTDPLKWRKPAVIATGFHGDWGRLSPEDMATVLAVMSQCPEHTFMPLTKQPKEIATLLAWDFLEDEIDAAGSRLGWCHANASGRIPLKNVSIGCSVMNQVEADKMREPMQKLHQLGWRTHVWYEPAIGPVNWSGWEFIERLIVGGESGLKARPFDLQWLRGAIAWGRDAGVAVWAKQLGAVPGTLVRTGDGCDGLGTFRFDDLKIGGRKGDDMNEWPADLRVREMPKK